MAKRTKTLELPVFNNRQCIDGLPENMNDNLTANLFISFFFHCSVLQREADFLERVAARRASSYSKFEDDYYGESIKTVSDYRQWLREQQKKQTMMEKYDSKEQSKEITTEAA